MVLLITYILRVHKLFIQLLWFERVVLYVHDAIVDSFRDGFPLRQSSLMICSGPYLVSVTDLFQRVRVHILIHCLEF
jgi:hypothetical protein